MKRLLVAAAVAACSSMANATIVRLEIESTVSYPMTSGTAWSIPDGSQLLLQVEVDESSAGDWLKWQAFVDGQLLTVPLPDFSASTASYISSQTYRPGSAMAQPEYVWLHSEANMLGWQFGHEPDGDYWESASYNARRGFALDLYSLSGLAITDGGFSGLKSDMPADLHAEGWIELYTVADSCRPEHIAYGCSTTPIEPSSASLSFSGGTFRLGWTDMTATVSAGPLAPLFGLLLWAGVRRQKRTA